MAPDRPGAGLEELPEIWQDFVRDDVVHLAKGVARDVHGWPPSLKAYVQIDVGVEIILRTISGYPTYFLVFAKRAVPKTEEGFKGEVIASRCRSGHNGPAHDAHGRVVLVGVPHLVEHAEPVLFHVGPSVIRLMTFQGVDAVRWHKSIEDRFREFVEGRPVLDQRESQIFASLQTRRGDGPNQVVQQGAQVVNEVGGNESEDRRYRLMAGDLEDIAAVLEITPTLGGIRLAAYELFDLNLKVVMVKLRSLKPPFKVQKADGGGHH